MSTFFKNAVVYQIYVRSFYDTNGDGLGDLRGVIKKLDYIKDLGANVLWLNPIFASPQDDNGYDISDYYTIYPPFGNVDDVKELINEAHKRDIRVLMDLVVNHSSDEHKWFLCSKSAKENPYRDYYFWKAPKGYKKNGTPIPPNNWGSIFGGSAWEYDEKTKEYYLHLFTKKQPDLNWENETLRQEIYKMMRYWMDLGVDGWRLDAYPLMSKNLAFPNYPKKKGQKYAVSPLFAKGEKIHTFLQEMQAEVFSYYDCMTVGEASFSDVKDAVFYTSPDRNELNMVFSFSHMGLYGEKGRVDLVKLKKALNEWQIGLHNNGWNALYWDNHDQPRIVSAYGNDGEFRIKSAMTLCACLMLMQGTPFIYQGDEIGMTNCVFKKNEYRDVEVKNNYNELVIKQKLMTSKEYFKSIAKKARDNARTPMQWDCSENAGFTTGTPWIKMNENHQEISASNQQEIINWYKKIIAYRKNNVLIEKGTFKLLLPKHKEIFAYERKLNGEKILVLCNFSEKEVTAKISGYTEKTRVLFSNYGVKEIKAKSIILRSWETVVFYLGL